MRTLRSISGKQWLAAALSGALQVPVFPKPGLYWLCWIALVPLFFAVLVAPRVEIVSPGKAPSNTARGFVLGYVSGFIWYMGSCYWVYNVMFTYGGLGAAVSAGILILFALYLGLYHAIFGAVLARIGNKSMSAALWCAPFLWVAVELARARITGFPWDLLGTAQVDNAALAQLATVTGAYGLSFVIAAVNAGIVQAHLLPGRRVAAWAALFAGIVLQLLMLVPLSSARPDQQATLVQANIPILRGDWSAQYFDETLASLTDISRANTPQGSESSPQLIVWPEAPAPFYPDDPKLHAWTGTLAQDRHAFVIMGTIGEERGEQPGAATRVFNSATLVAPTGAFVARYDKVHLVPFGEYVPFKQLLFFAGNLTREVGDFSRGTERKVFTLSEHGGSSGHKLGVFICYESVFPDEVRQFAENGAELFVNISNDGWYGDTGAPPQHLNMVRMRAIENHRWVLRATNTGITSSIDPYGRVVARAARNVRTVLVAPFAYESGSTFYTRHGDWFAYACAIISLIALFGRVNMRAGTLQR